jgi:hypothetical protein
MGNLMLELTLSHTVAGFNSHKNDYELSVSRFQEKEKRGGNDNKK